MLRHGEHEDEIEEQFDMGDPRVPGGASQMILARREHLRRHSD
jgi:hypothetical protein